MDEREIGEPIEEPYPSTQREFESSVLKTAPTWYETPGSTRANLDSNENCQVMSPILVPLEVLYPKKETGPSNPFHDDDDSDDNVVLSFIAARVSAAWAKVGGQRKKHVAYKSPTTRQ